MQKNPSWNAEIRDRALRVNFDVFNFFLFPEIITGAVFCSMKEVLIKKPKKNIALQSFMRCGKFFYVCKNLKCCEKKNHKRSKSKLRENIILYYIFLHELHEW